MSAPRPTPPTPASSAQVRPTSPENLSLGLLLGALGVAIFAMTLPMTRLAVGPASDPQLPPLFVTAARAAMAGVLSLIYLAALRASAPSTSSQLTAAVTMPTRADVPALAICALGTVLGFPLCLALALRDVDAMHAAVVTGVLPLGTALAAAWWLRQRASLGFWVCAVAGCGLVLAFALWAGQGALSAADGWLLLAVACASVGYVAGAHAARKRPASQVICWVLVLSLPFTVPMAWLTMPASLAGIRPSAWLGLAYVTVFSMWLGFFAWYRGLLMGGVMRVSQIQLLQPFLALLFAVPVLGEPLEAQTIGFALAVMAVVFVGKRMPVHAPRARP